jgi:hypothetical protein
VFRYREEGRDWQFEEPGTFRGRGGGNRNNKKDSRRPSHGPRNGTELDLDAISECLGTDQAIIEGMKKASENGDFDHTKVG